MTHSREINEAIQKLAGTFMQDSVSLFLATVDSVDEDNKMCNVTPLTTNADTSLSEVYLAPETDDGVLIVPSIGSVVIVSVSKRGVAYVAMFSSIDKITMYSQVLTTLNDGSYGGLIIIQELVDKINRLENAFNTHTHSGVTTGTGTSATVVSPITPITQRSELENTRITHGK